MRIALRALLCLLVGVFALPLHMLTHPPTAALAASDCTSDLPFGETLLCALATAGEVDQFSFAASAGDRVFVRVASRTSGLYPQVRLYAPDATLLCQSPNYGALADIDGCMLPTTGTYSVAVNAYSGTAAGNYGISLQRLNAPVAATALAFGTLASASLIAEGEIDTYTFSVDADDVLFVAATSSASALRLAVRVYRQDGSALCQDSTYSVVLELESCALAAGQTYTLLVLSFSNAAMGNYGVVAQRTRAPGNSATLPLGVPVAATLAGMGEVDTYSFSASAQDMLLVRMGTSGFQPRFRLYGPDGALVCSLYRYGVEVEQDNCLLPSTGIYTLLVSVFNQALTGSYGVEVQRVNAPARAVPLLPGVLATGAFTVTGGLGTYAVAATAGDALVVRMGATTAGMRAQVRVFGDDGAKLCDNASSAVIAQAGPCLIPRTGSYTVVVTPWSRVLIGEFGVSFQRLNAPEQAHELYFGRAASAALAHAASLDTWTFHAAGGSTVLLRMGVTSGAARPQISLFDRDGTKLCSNASSYSATTEIGRCLLPDDDTYTVVAASQNGGVGSYALSLACLSDTCGGVVPPEERVFLPLLQR
ncbi:hypothetical protein F8S13_02635 [Chloroflexia bacterium SDU3-3]|nr:hypothetical protein F8S13_02635 [Chloroflexia bacterium SDU3-3]